MGNARTNSLHEKLDVEMRKAVERDLVEQPPGRETYAKVYEYYELAGRDVSLKAVERYGGYLRAMARNRWITHLGDLIAGRDLGDDVRGLIRTRLFEVLACGEEASTSDLMKASITEANIVQAQVKREQWEAEKSKQQEAIRKAIEAEADKRPDKKLDTATVIDLIDRAMRSEEFDAA